ncbi:hypothetical protein PSE_1413 [Pseudovibrio sp. FO-BEG1]|nr:hypothetical protein PSE_1413 [Pseudovibrio sp. FO-BEG1]
MNVGELRENHRCYSKEIIGMIGKTKTTATPPSRNWAAD